MFLNVLRRLLFIYFVCLHLHCCLTGTERFVNTPFTCYDRIIRISSSILQAQWPAVFILHVCEIMNAIAYLCRLKYYCFIMSGKRKKDDSEAVGIMQFFKSTERNRISSKEPSDIAERSSISSATESVQINESTCSATSSPVDDHSSRTCSGIEQTTVIATPTITDVLT